MSVDEVADELYALSPEAFVAIRDARAKTLAGEGDRAAAVALRRLSKPSLAAWLVNSIVREHPAEVNQLLGLMTEFKGVQGGAARERIRELSSRRQALIVSLVGHAGTIASRRGHAMTAAVEREVERTLEAAVADEEAATALRGGRLTKSLSHVGFGSLDLDTSGPTSGGSKARGRSPLRSGGGDRGAHRRDERINRLRQAHEKAGVALDEARRRHRAAAEGRREAATRLAQAERRHARAAAAVARAETAEKTARAALRQEERA